MLGECGVCPFERGKKKKYSQENKPHDSILQRAVLSLGSGQEHKREVLLSILVQGLSYRRMQLGTREEAPHPKHTTVTILQPQMRTGLTLPRGQASIAETQN